TTSLRMMLGLIAPSAGSVRLFGRDPQASVKALQGVAGFVEAPTFYPYLNGRTNLDLFAALDGDGAKGRIEEALEIVGLSDRAKDRVGTYSHGMRQRLGIAASLLRAPRLLLLDEPATGLDPGGMRDMRDLIRDLSAKGMTVLLSSHLLTEVEELCNRVAIVREGRVAYQGSLRELRAQAGSGYLLRTTDDERARRVAEAQEGIVDVAPAPERGLAFSAESEGAIAALSLALAESGALILELSSRQATLEDLFFRLTEGAEAETAKRERALEGAA
ncbi:MAG: type transport system ATP-binding protein, partial [Solirubrobacterales bacterium]|nr:type transport system ATP-binding protein [Solirubrobacterales bacterium]